MDLLLDHNSDFTGSIHSFPVDIYSLAFEKQCIYFLISISCLHSLQVSIYWCLIILIFSPKERKAPMANYVGFANLPNQVHRKSVKKGFEFTLMVVGEFSVSFLSTKASHSL